MLYCYKSTNALIQPVWDVSINCFYPTALKGCQGIVFTLTHGGRVGGGKKFVRAVSQKPYIRCRKLILGRDIG